MKKVLYFAAIAAMFAACSSEELADQNVVQQNNNGVALNFSVYTPRNITRAGLDSTITTKSLKEGYHQEAGFGVMAYYTDNAIYGTTATPNFMYNQQVKYSGSAWGYEPVKYWPNEFGNKAISDEIDRVTFFAYAPWIEVNPTNGKPVIKSALDSKEDTLQFQKKNIIQISNNTAQGDPVIKYVVDTDPATSVDLLWGVNGNPTRYNPIDPNYTDQQNVEGLPFIDLLKPVTPLVEDTTIEFNLRHALAKVRITIDYVDDAYTPNGPAAQILNADETRIYLRNISINGFALEGALNLNNIEPNQPNWKNIEGTGEIQFIDNIFNDGRKDNAEGKTNGAAREDNAFLNPTIVENDDPDAVTKQNGKTVFGAAKSEGITATPKALFAGDLTRNGGFFYVIPRNDASGQVDIKAEYDVETIDTVLASKLSDNITRGLSTKNFIYKEDIFKGQKVTDFMAGYQYEINIHVGMTSVKITASVTDWDDTVPATFVDLPDNQDGPVADGNGGGGGAATPGEQLADALETLSQNLANVDVEYDPDTNTADVTLNTGVTGTTSSQLQEVLAQMHEILGINTLTVSGETNNTNNGDYPWNASSNDFIKPGVGLLGNWLSDVIAAKGGNIINQSSGSVTATDENGVTYTFNVSRQ